MRDLVVYGAGGLGREVLRIAEDINATRSPSERNNILGFFDDGVPEGTLFGRYPVLGGLSRLQSWETTLDVALGIASPEIKRRLVDALSANTNLFYPVLRHPLSSVASDATLSQGCVIAQFAFVSLDSRLDPFVFMNTGAQAGHDCRIGKYVSIMPSVNVSGNVVIGGEAFLGVKATILQGLSVGESATVGAGSLVISDVPAGCTVLGNPARIVKRPEKTEIPEK